MPKKFDNLAVEFSDQLLNLEHGTKYHQLHLFHVCRWVGYVHYSQYRGQPTIHHVGVPCLSDRRCGFATALVQRLQQTFPGRQIGWLGTGTSDGASFYAALPKIEKKVQSVIDQRRHLDTLIRQRDIMLLADSEPLTSWSRRELSELQENISDLEISLGGKSTLCILVETTGAVPYPGFPVSA